MAILEITHLSKRYKDVCALSDVSLKVRAGEFVTVIGRSGAGKSTLLRCVNRLVEANSGSIEFDGVQVLTLKKHDLRHLRTRIGMIFQHFNLVPRQTVIENVLHGLLGYKSTLAGVLGVYTPEEKEKAFDILDRLGLKDQIHKRCDQLSGGQKQRLAIALALVHEPRVVFLDEPTAGLDPQVRREIYDIIEELKSDKKTILLTTHYIEEAEKLCDRVAIVDRGKIIAEGTPRELKQRSGDTTRIEVRLSRPPRDGALKTLDGVTDVFKSDRDGEPDFPAPVGSSTSALSSRAR